MLSYIAQEILKDIHTLAYKWSIFALFNWSFNSSFWTKKVSAYSCLCMHSNKKSIMTNKQ